MQRPGPIWLIIIALALVAVYIAGLQVDIMDVDASQYASISQEMLQNGQYLQVQHQGQDYLDKPPLLFWTTTLAYQLFGVHNWSYKLFSLLFSLLGVYSTFRFAKLYYSHTVAFGAALMLATCQALFLINNDVRTDTMLIGAVMLAIWQLAQYLQSERWLYLFGASAGIALAMLAKGPIGLMVPVLAFGSDWFFKRQWSNFVRWQWLVVVALVGLALSPMLYGLYKQHGSFGPYFYFWAQSFGRLTGDNPFINSGMGKQPFSPLFFTHTFLWSFLPWSLLAVAGLSQQLKSFAKNTFQIPTNQEAITLWGFVLPFIALSFSDYKLPHYIYVLFPFAAIQAARYAVQGAKKTAYWQIAISTLFLLLSGVLGLWAFPVQQGWVWAVFVFLFVAAAYYCFAPKQWFLACLLAALASNWIINASTYPKLLQYQSTSVAGKDIANLQPESTIALHTRGHALDYYAGHVITYFEAIPGTVTQGGTTITNVIARGTYIFTNQQGLDELYRAGYQIEIVKAYPHYKVTAITWAFINPKSRNQTLQERYLVKVL